MHEHEVGEAVGGRLESVAGGHGIDEGNIPVFSVAENPKGTVDQRVAPRFQGDGAGEDELGAARAKLNEPESRGGGDFADTSLS